MLHRLLDEAEAVLFDFDGVLVDSERFYYLSYNRAFQKRGHTIREEDYWEYWTSKGEGIAGEVRRHDLPFDQAEMKAIYRERMANYTAFCRDGKIPFVPGMIEALQSLIQKGLPCSIASSAIREDVFIIFDRAGYPTPPCPIVGRVEGLRPKPHPDIFLYAAGMLGKTPARCLVIEDAHKGLEAAKTCGMRCVILRNDLNQEFDFPDADLVLDSRGRFAALSRQWKEMSAS